MPLPVTDLLLLLAAVPIAALGGEAFLAGVIQFSERLRLPRFLIASTIAAFATSSPELTVSTLAAFDAQPAIGLGDALGSNVVNIALVLGLALLFGPLPVRTSGMRRDFLLATAAPVLLLWLAADGTISRHDGGILLVAFALWLVVVIRAGRHERAPHTPLPAIARDRTASMTALQLGGGLTALLVAGKCFVAGAGGLANALHLHAYVVGAIVVAVGTSLPELVTALLARYRGHDDIGFGTLLGSNLFNGLAIVGTAASIHPIRVPLQEMAIAAGFGLLALLLAWPRAERIPRARAPALLALYAGFVSATWLAGQR